MPSLLTSSCHKGNRTQKTQKDEKYLRSDLNKENLCTKQTERNFIEIHRAHAVWCRIKMEKLCRLV